MATSFLPSYLAHCRAAGVAPHPDILPRMVLGDPLAAPTAVPPPSWAPATGVSEPVSLDDAHHLRETLAEEPIYDCTSRNAISVNGPCDVGPLFAALRGAPTDLCSLSLRGACLTAPQIRELAALLPGVPSLVELKLDWNDGEGNNEAEFAGAIATLLERRPSRLKRLSLRGNALGALAATALGAALRFNTTLHELSLAYNRGLGEAPGAIAGLMAGVRDNRALTALSLADCGLTDAALTTIAAGVEATYAMTRAEARERAAAEVGEEAAVAAAAAFTAAAAAAVMQAAALAAAAAQPPTRAPSAPSKTATTLKAPAGANAAGKGATAATATTTTTTQTPRAAPASAAARDRSSTGVNGKVAAAVVPTVDTKVEPSPALLYPLRVLRCGPVAYAAAAAMAAAAMAAAARAAAAAAPLSAKQQRQQSTVAAAEAVSKESSTPSRSSTARVGSGGASSVVSGGGGSGGSGSSSGGSSTRLPPIASAGRMRVLATTSTAPQVLPSGTDSSSTTASSGGSSSSSRGSTAGRRGKGEAPAVAAEAPAGVAPTTPSEVPVCATFDDPEAVLEGRGATQLLALDLACNPRLSMVALDALRRRGEPLLAAM